MRFAIGLTVLLAACGSHTPVYSVPPEVEPIVQKFMGLAKDRGLALATNDLIVQFTNAPETTMDGSFEAAHCTSQNGTPLIVIHQGPWEMTDATGDESIMFHEMGHCFLLRAHRADLNADGTPASIMNPEAPTSQVYLAHYQNYLDELFDPSRIGGL